MEQKIADTLQEKFSNTNNDLLYKRDLESSQYCEYVFGGKDTIGERILRAEDNYEVFASLFDWTLLDTTVAPSKAVFEKILSSEEDHNSIAIIPECYSEGYSMVNLGSLDMLLLQLLKTPLPVKVLLQEAAKAFDKVEIENAFPEFQSLIYDRIKLFLQRKLIRPVG